MDSTGWLKSDIYTWIYPWIYPWISISTASLDEERKVYDYKFFWVYFAYLLPLKKQRVHVPNVPCSESYAYGR